MASSGGAAPQFRILGPLEVRVGDVVVPIEAPRQRALLGALLLNANEVVAIDRLVECQWGDSPPPTARNTLQTLVLRLRRLLEDAGVDSARLLVTRRPGYLLNVRPDQLDVPRFGELAEAGRGAATAGDPAGAAEAFRQALALWRGRALADLELCQQCGALTAALEEQRLAVLEERVSADLELGRHRELLGELRTLTAQHPLRERLWGQMMLALYRSDQRVEALDVYRRVYHLLTGEIGVEPGEALQELHRRMLDADPALVLRPFPTRPVAVPRQLPASVAGFVGRSQPLRRLAGLSIQGHAPRALVIAVIAGTAGVGKTALAVYWAHQVAGRFPDGQLYVNLRGFDPAGSPVSPAEAIRSFLDAFAVPPERIPAGLDAQAALYRSLLAQRRMLVVLDNARDVDQVRPLLPGNPDCVVLVTSRNQLAGLVATEGAHLINLDLFTAVEARMLLSRRLGPDRVAAEPDAVEQIITRCARLPLALTIVAARAAAHPDFPLAAVAGQLHDAGGLESLTGGDTATDVRAVFSWSYDVLGDEEARLFRLLGLHPGPDATVAAAASLAGWPLKRARPLLAGLTRAHLLTEPTPGRYACHDLLHAYADELAGTIDSDAERRLAVHRMLDHYLHTAHAAAMAVEPHRVPIELAGAQPGVVVEDLSSIEHALAWFTAEHAVLLNAIELAAGAGFDTHAWQLAWTMVNFLQRRGHWHDWTATQHAALAAACRLGDLTGQAHTHRALARAYTHLGFGWLLERDGNYREAFNHARQALELFERSGHLAGLARALNNAGWCCAMFGDHQQALEYCHRALRLQQEVGDRQGEADTWGSVGYVHHNSGRPQQAIACYRRALELFREAGDRYNEADTLVRLGEAHDAARDGGAADEAWHEALAILDELCHPEAENVRARLAAHARAAPAHRQ